MEKDEPTQGETKEGGEGEREMKEEGEVPVSGSVDTISGGDFEPLRPPLHRVNKIASYPGHTPSGKGCGLGMKL